LSVSITQHLRYPLVGHAASTGAAWRRSSGDRRCENMAPGHAAMWLPRWFSESSDVRSGSDRSKQIRTTRREPHLIAERFEGHRRQRYLGHSVWSL
jgi:hypothetical protein